MLQNLNFGFAVQFANAIHLTTHLTTASTSCCGLAAYACGAAGRNSLASYLHRIQCSLSSRDEAGVGLLALDVPSRTADSHTAFARPLPMDSMTAM